MRYEIIRKNEGLRFQKECPLLIVGSAITKDNQKEALLAQIKFLNISSKKISALYIQVQGIGADGEPFSKLDQFTYLDLNVDGFAEFGANTPLYLSNIQTRDLIIVCQKIIYEDDSVWQSNLETNFIKLSLANSVETLINTEAYKELYQELTEQKVSFAKISKPSSEGNIHLCGCGKYFFGNSKCPYCGKDFEWWNNQLDEGELLKKKNIRDEAIRKKQEEEKQHAEQLAKETTQKKENYIKKVKNSLKKLGIIMCIIVAMVLVYVFINNVIIPSQNYNKACEYAKNEDYENAIKWIEKADGYKDSIAKKEEFENMQKYQKGIAFMEDKEYVKAMEIWTSLGEFKDSQTQFNNAREKQNKKDYKTACEKISNLEFESAESILIRLGNYQDSAELLKEVHYQQALIMMKKTEYSEAISMFSELGEYKDSVEQSIIAKQKTLENPQNGDIVYYGAYEQDGNTDNGKEPIKWKVIDTWENGFSAVSVYCLDYREYLVGNDYLNRWLDTEFMQKAFSVEEQKHSKVQLLELSTLKSDFPNDSDRAATPTQYARSKSNSNSSKTTCEYWYDHKSILNLEKDYEAPLVSEGGHFSPSLGQYMLSPNYVRPELIYHREPLK